MERWKVLSIKEIGYLAAIIAEGVISDPDACAKKLRQIAFAVEKFSKNR